MKYTKLPLTIPDQILRLKQRGLTFNNEPKAAHYLSNISYYRLRAYTYPFQDNTNSNHPFVKPVTFEQIIELYVFDRQLRLLLFNAIEKIEVALRTQIIYHYALVHGSHWPMQPSLFNNMMYFAEHTVALQKEVLRSKEAFIDHYLNTYTDPKEPASWMGLEVSSMGLLSKIFENLKNDKTKDQIAYHFGLKDVHVMGNWVFCISILRNICAHHGRVWNRRLPKITILKKATNPYITNKGFYPNKLYAYLVSINYMLNVISPGHGFKNNLVQLMSQCPLLQEKEMGFPVGWQNEQYWK